MTRLGRDTPETLRRREVERQRFHLETFGQPRLQMMLIVALTGLGGFLASFVMLHLGVSSMALRYPLAVGAAYLVFLILLWLWLRTTRDDYDIEDPGIDTGRGRSGGESGSDCGVSSAPPESADASGLGDVGEALGGADEFALPLIVLALAAALLFASGWIVYSAPLLFAELLVDGVLAASLYRRLKGGDPGLETRHWLETAVRRTGWPFAATALVFCIAGAVMHQLAPEARSIGGFIHRDG